MEYEQLKAKLLTLCNQAWGNRTDWPSIQRWLQNFRGEADDVEAEQLHALYLLSHLSFFSLPLIREMLKTAYRQLYKYPLVQAIRRANGDTRDATLIEACFQRELRVTRFLGVGNPAESGTHLLYYFRQVNELPSDLFSDVRRGRLVSTAQTGGNTNNVTHLNVRRVVYIDDLLGTGNQVIRELLTPIASLRRTSAGMEIHYCALFATTTGLAATRESDLFDTVSCIFELDDSFKCFEPASRYFVSPEQNAERESSRKIAHSYGTHLFPRHALGYGDGQLLLAFEHNTPNNTLPIIWSERLTAPVWVPIFKRFSKS